MNLMVDAWIDRLDACLRILDRDTGRELMRWNAAQLYSAVEDGLISLHDLEQGQPSDEELLNMVGCLGA